MTFLKEFALAFWAVTLDMAPWLLFGIGVAALMGAFVPTSIVKRHLGASGFASTFKAAVFGIPLPLCSCSVIPTGVGLYRSGASRGAAVSFITATPQTGVESIFLTAGVFGIPFAIAKVLAAMLMAVFAGWFTELESKKEKVEKAAREHSGSCCSSSIEKERNPGFFHLAFRSLPRDLGFPLYIGLLISAFISTVLAPGTLGNWVGGGVTGMLVALAFATPVYVCATVSIPLALVLANQGFEAGAILVFLTAGPATNAATVLTVGNIFGRRALFAYLGTIIAGSLILGFLLERVLELNTQGQLHEHADGMWWEHLAGIALLALLAPPAFSSLKGHFKKLRPGRQPLSSCCSSPTVKRDKPSCCSSSSAVKGNPDQATSKPETDKPPRKSSCCSSADDESKPEDS